MKKFAQVIISNVKGLGSRPFTYAVPEDLENAVKIGSPVSVPFGNSGSVNGFVTGFVETPDEGFKIKEIEEIIDEEFSFEPEFMRLFMYVSKYYVCDLNTVIQNVFPSKLFGKYRKEVKLLTLSENLNETEKEVCKTLSKEKFLVLNGCIKKSKLPRSKFLTALRSLKNKNNVEIRTVKTDTVKTKTKNYVRFVNENGAKGRSAEILTLLKNKKECLVSEFVKEAKTTYATLKKLEKSGNVAVFEQTTYRNPLNVYKDLPQTNFPTLNEAQQKAYEFIKQKIKNKEKEPILLHGITASGKTEVYFALINDILKKGKNILFLAPEIAITSMLTKKTAQRFGMENVALWHSKISEGEKHDIREKMKNNEIKILIGARSAVFAPLKNIGLIIIDEEHEDSYKQSAPEPFYNACEVAKILSAIHGATLVKGSATPDVCSFYDAKKANTLVQIKKRFNGQPLAKVEVVNMAEEFSSKGQKIFSRYLIEAINDTLSNKKQVLLLMNRLGYSTTVQCQNCGTPVVCPNCELPLTWHKSDKILKCHKCDYSSTFPAKCNVCGSSEFKFFGSGTEKISEIASKLFPEAIIARMDSQSMTGKNTHSELLRDFEEGKIDILIGTQMSAKGLDNPNVTLVGALNTDTSFAFPDYRCEERGFQLLTQLAGRAGRGNFPARIIFQTFNPEFFTFRAAQNQNYEKFYEREISLRKEFKLPPFCRTVNIVFSGENLSSVQACANDVAEKFREFTLKNSANMAISKPEPCFFEKINNRYRYYLLLKNFDGKRGHSMISFFFGKVSSKSVKILIDTSPRDFL